jgi:hypothetical protein
LDFSAAASPFNAATEARDRFWMKRYSASAALRIFLHLLKKTFATISAKNGSDRTPNRAVLKSLPQQPAVSIRHPSVEAGRRQDLEHFDVAGLNGLISPRAASRRRIVRAELRDRLAAPARSSCVIKILTCSGVSVSLKRSMLNNSARPRTVLNSTIPLAIPSISPSSPPATRRGRSVSLP